MLLAYLCNLQQNWQNQRPVSHSDSLEIKHFMFAPLPSQWHSTKRSHQARGSVIYKDYQRNMMSKDKLKLCARPTGRLNRKAAQTEWMYLLFMWKSMCPGRWRFVSSLFTRRLHDKCPCCPSWADGAQVSRKPSTISRLQMDNRCIGYCPISFFVSSPIYLSAVDLATANILELISKEKICLFNNPLHQINIRIFIFITLFITDCSKNVFSYEKQHTKLFFIQ